LNAHHGIRSLHSGRPSKAAAVDALDGKFGKCGQASDFGTEQCPPNDAVDIGRKLVRADPSSDAGIVPAFAPFWTSPQQRMRWLARALTRTREAKPALGICKKACLGPGDVPTTREKLMPEKKGLGALHLCG